MRWDRVSRAIECLPVLVGAGGVGGIWLSNGSGDGGFAVVVVVVAVVDGDGSSGQDDGGGGAWVAAGGIGDDAPQRPHGCKLELLDGYFYPACQGWNQRPIRIIGKPTFLKQAGVRRTKA